MQRTFMIATLLFTSVFASACDLPAQLERTRASQPEVTARTAPTAPSANSDTIFKDGFEEGTHYCCVAVKGECTYWCKRN